MAAKRHNENPCMCPEQPREYMNLNRRDGGKPLALTIYIYRGIGVIIPGNRVGRGPVDLPCSRNAQYNRARPMRAVKGRECDRR